VEDFTPFRQFICSTLKEAWNVRNIAEACDGKEAVALAKKLQPHLIVMDIGLPKLNGLEAARQIRKLSPESKILFLSQESSEETVLEAICIGAMGYVVKFDAGSELLVAAEAVLRGERFIGARFAGGGFFDPLE
jgi:DNA-binding NarL/FixJ family response regulator